MPTAAIRGLSFSPPFAKSSGKSTWKSSSVPIQQRALRSCPSDGSSSAPSPGSIAVAAWPRIGSASTERPWRSCALPQSASCSESSVKKQHDPGQTLRALQVVGLGQPEHLTPTKAHQRRGFRYFDPARSQILQHAHPVDLRPAHRNHRHRPKTPQPKPWRVTSLSGPKVTSQSGVYMLDSHKVYYGISMID